jgi:hypothetical protein
MDIVMQLGDVMHAHKSLSFHLQKPFTATQTANSGDGRSGDGFSRVKEQALARGSSINNMDLSAVTVEYATMVEQGAEVQSIEARHANVILPAANIISSTMRTDTKAIFGPQPRDDNGGSGLVVDSASAVWGVPSHLQHSDHYEITSSPLGAPDMVQMGTFASNTFTRRGFCSNPTFKTGGVPPRRQYAAPSTQEIISSEFFDDRSFSSPASLFSFGSSTVLASSLQPLSAPKKSLVSLPSSLASSSTTATLSGSTATAVAKQKQQQQQQQQQQDAHQNYESRSDPASGALAMRSNL